MPAQRQPQAGVIGDDVLAFGGRGQIGCGFDDRSRSEQRRTFLYSRNQPRRVAAMPGQRCQRAGFGEEPQVAAVEFRPQREVVDGGTRGEGKAKYTTRLSLR